MPIMPYDTLLVMPSTTYARSYQTAIAEGYEPDAMAPPATPIEPHLAWLNIQGDQITTPSGDVVTRGPHVQLWLVHAYTFIGRINIRFRLNESLQVWGGNIGYAIRPSFRQRGFGRHVLAQALPLAREAGLSGVLLTCLDTNLGSIRIIEANGGTLTGTGPHPYHPGETVRRYWIAL
jgi:predicted acetyltransferase